MRPILLALVLVAPIALAQAPDLTSIELTVEPFSEPVRPLQATVSTTATARIPCTLIRSPSGAAVQWSILDAPAWASVTVSPATDTIDLGSCQEGFVRPEVQIIVQANDQAPAYSPRDISIEVAVEGERADAATPIEATYFSIVDVQLQETQRIVAPGGVAEFPVKLTNYGNGATRVDTWIVAADPGLTVEQPAPVALESRQQGGSAISHDLILRVRAADEEGIVNRVGVVNVRFQSAYAEDAAETGDNSSASFLVTVRSGALDRAANVPAAGVVVLTAALSLGAALRRR